MCWLIRRKGGENKGKKPQEAKKEKGERGKEKKEKEGKERKKEPEVGRRVQKAILMNKDLLV